MTMDAAREAATIVITRLGPAGTEVLMLRRSPDSPAFPGMWVFPGGTVSSADRDNADPLRAAAVREAAEECGLVIAPEELQPLSKWLPPATARARFDTRFYRAEFVEGDVRTDDYEVVDHAWITADAALARHAEGAWDFMPPTWVTLARLAGAGNGEVEGPDEFHSHVVGADPTVLAWHGDEHHPYHPGPPGARHRITLGARPWVYLRHGPRTAETAKPKEAVA
ncbi:NUDIX domain-containing protein [Microbacterium sp. Root166]|uniref:NUDIX domain-containing protein n=1 Tax=Microbacterium sp. Root166 TaxID=1736478 RepID=UPI0009EAF829|nr:NUDIX domain-containing protein [Microbacterium sp. Root166]